ncbi:hypothetical protein BDV30DRAFT_50847 [Aspergillus minisclerotigenes]|uniref:Uncharacterized protein n=1 Tax=Aspergillus minisclerotigenes TaxID=656917 RepID=A0A5N6IL56_9EURO|nr:hypothetical protein BDV30DRAFT_50847 [Aspergillus minisclerotigenes]
MLMFWGDTRMVVYLFAAKGLKEQQLSYTKTTLNKQPAALKQLRQYRPGKFGREISNPPHFNLMRNEEICPPQHLKLSHEGGEGTRVVAEKNESDEQTIPSSLGNDGTPIIHCPVAVTALLGYRQQQPRYSVSRVAVVCLCHLGVCMVCVPQTHDITDRVFPSTHAFASTAKVTPKPMCEYLKNNFRMLQSHAILFRIFF